MIRIDPDKIRIICKLNSPDGSSKGCENCPLNTDICHFSMIALGNGDWEELENILKTFKIPTYEHFLRAVLPIKFYATGLISHCKPKDVFIYVDNNAEWEDQITIDFLEKFYPED